MTIFTDPVNVNSFKQKISQSVIKSLAVEFHDICCPALVFRMASGTFDPANRLRPPMKS